MPAQPSGQSPLAFEIKSAQWPVVALGLRSADPEQLQRDWQARFADTPDFFDQDPLLIDLSALSPSEAVPAFDTLLPLLRQYRLQPLAFKGGNGAQQAAARAAGLVPADDATLLRAVSAANAEPPAPTPAVAATPAASAMVLDRPLRSGQQVYARGRDLVVLAMVNPGAEVIADGHIHVYAPLRGKAIAGARGQADARIFAQSLEAELISIAGVYRTSDIPLPDTVRAKPAQVRLHSSGDGDRLLIEPIS